MVIGYGLMSFGVLLIFANAMQFFFVAHEEAMGKSSLVFILILYIATAIPIVLVIGIALFNVVNLGV